MLLDGLWQLAIRIMLLNIWSPKYSMKQIHPVDMPTFSANVSIQRSNMTGVVRRGFVVTTMKTSFCALRVSEVEYTR
jgi:hypothetical protein